jgi:hypothetical protein
MTDPVEADDAATLLTPAEREGLIPTHITLRSELNELEQQNIADASAWAFERKRNVLDEAFLKGLHRRMFNKRCGAGRDNIARLNAILATHLILFSQTSFKRSETPSFGFKTTHTPWMNWRSVSP